MRTTATAHTCDLCGADIMFAITNNRKRMPLDPPRRDRDDTTANVAVYKDHTGRLNARQLCKGEQPEPWEWRALPHFASCPVLKERRAAGAGGRRGDSVIPLPRRTSGKG